MVHKMNETQIQSPELVANWNKNETRDLLWYKEKLKELLFSHYSFSEREKELLKQNRELKEQLNSALTQINQISEEKYRLEFQLNETKK